MAHPTDVGVLSLAVKAFVFALRVANLSLCSGVSAVPEEGGGLGMIPPEGTLGGFDM